MEVVNNIKRFRKLRALSQKQVSMEIGITQAQYSVIESGKTVPTIPTLEKIAKALQIHITDFFKNPNEEEENINLSILEKIKIIDTLEEDEKSYLMGIIDMAIAKKKLKDNLSQLLKAS